MPYHACTVRPDKDGKDIVRWSDPLGDERPLLLRGQVHVDDSDLLTSVFGRRTEEFEASQLVRGNQPGEPGTRRRLRRGGSPQGPSGEDRFGEQESGETCLRVGEVDQTLRHAWVAADKEEEATWPRRSHGSR